MRDALVSPCYKLEIPYFDVFQVLLVSLLVDPRVRNFQMIDPKSGAFFVGEHW